MEFVQGVFDVQQNGDVYESRLVVPFQCASIVNSTFTVLHHLIFFMEIIDEVLQIIISLIFLPKFSTTNVNTMTLFLYLHRTGVIGAGA